MIRYPSGKISNNIKAKKVTKAGQFSVRHSEHTAYLSTKLDHRICFGPFSIEPQNARLRSHHQVLSLTPKAFAVLDYLVESAGQLLTRDTIFAQVWPTTVVTDAALTVCIREIRNVLGDDAKNPRYIETVQKRGYRFICETYNRPDTFENNPKTSTFRYSDHSIVGRDRPLRQMKQCVETALSGKRQLVFVTGEPGIGKTTLVDAFMRQTLQSTEPMVAKGHCIEHYGTGEAYLPLLDAIGGLGLKEGHAFTEILARYAPTWLEQLPALWTSLDSPGPQARSADIHQQRMLREITEALEVICEKRLLILILEDLHWSDHATIDLLSFVARRSHPVNLLIVATYRPADADRQNHPVKNLKQDLQPRDRCTSIPLEFLNQQHIVNYLSAIFPGHYFPRQFPDLIHQHSDGNPLFMVNLLKYLQNADCLKKVDGQWLLVKKLTAQDRCMPDDIQLMVNQQIEQLDRESQTLLETASIASEPGGIAAPFTLNEVATALGIDDLDAEPRLERLARNGHFLNSIRVTEWPDGSVTNGYEFTHALYQNVLYERVSMVRRARIHYQLGLHLENAYLGHSAEIANKLAVHFEIGRDYPRAVRYLQETAETAARRGANREAILTLNKARQLLTKLPQTDDRDRQEIALLLLLAPAITASQGNATPEIEACYLRARELCNKLGEKTELFRVLFGLRSFYIICGNLSKAHRLAESLMGLATTLNHPNFLIEARVGLASSEFFAGNHQASHQHALKGIALYENDTHANHATLYGLDPGVFCYARAGQTIWPLGYPDQALNYEQRAVELAESLDHPYSLVFAIHNRSQVLLYRRDGEAALASTWRGKELALQHEFSFLSAWAFHLSAWAYALVGDSESALSEINQAIGSKRPNALVTDSYLALFLAETFRLLGDAKSGLSSLATPREEHSYDTERLRLQAEFILLHDDSKTATRQAEALFKEALKKSRQEGVRAYELRTAISLAKLLMRSKRNQEAYDYLVSIVHWFQEGFDTSELQEANQLLAQLDTVLKKDRHRPNIVYLDSLMTVDATM